MAKEKEKEPESEAPVADNSKDPSGVPWENRAKEYERKLLEVEQRLEVMRANQQAVTEGAPASDEDTIDLESEKALLEEFVKRPSAVIRQLAEEVVESRESVKSVEEAKRWIQSRPGYSSDDDIKIFNIINEYDLMHLPPTKRAESAWKLLENSKRQQQEFETLRKKEMSREKRITETTTEGPGRKPTTTGVGKDALLKKLASTRSITEQAKIWDEIESLRENLDQ